MRLADFILTNVEPILSAWEAFARSIWPSALTDVVNDPATLRDHAQDILLATANDMVSDQSSAQRADKSEGEGRAGKTSDGVDTASGQHGTNRVGSGFNLWAVVAEYRALRASVLRLWRASDPTPDLNDIDDLTRFNESIDQSLTGAVRAYTEQVKRDREALLAGEQSARMESDAANRAKDNFLATLSHEMRTPINAIVGWVGILRSAGCNETDLAEGLDVIERNTKAQVKLIEDVLDVSRIVSGKLRLDIRRCDLRDAINAGIDAVRPAAAARGIALEVQLEPSANAASCDAARMQQVVWNLVSNAIKFTPKGGTVRVTFVRDRSDLRLTVSDNGQGISPDFLPYIFDRFRQAEGGSRRKFGGLGLGLSIVKHLVEMHGGTVGADSLGENRGSTFTVRLPVHAVHIEEPGDRSDPRQSDDKGASSGNSGPPPVRLDGLRVLVVDDEADSRRMLLKVLQGVGASVVVAGSAAEALAVLPVSNGERGVDVLVSDLGMPDQDGYDLIREIRRRGHQARDLPAVALTGFAHKDDAREAVLAGFQVHIPKPVDLHDLTAVIASLAGRTG